MPLTTDIQFRIIVYALLSGLLIGAIFDLYRIIRGSNVNKFIMAIEDIMFGILTALIIFTFLLYTNYAFLGIYVYIFMIVSFLLYLKFVSNIVVRFELSFIEATSKILRIIFKNFIYPFRVIFYNMTGKK